MDDNGVILRYSKLRFFAKHAKTTYSILNVLTYLTKKHCPTHFHFRSLLAFQDVELQGLDSALLHNDTLYCLRDEQLST
jgi:hypothetical protein